MLARELVKRDGVKVQFITRGAGGAETFERYGIHVIKLPCRNTSLTRALFGTFDLTKTLLSLKSDILIQRGGGIETGIAGFAARWKRIPFLFMTSHDWDVDGTHAYKRGWLYGWIYRYGLLHSIATVTQSDYQRDLLEKNYDREIEVIRSSHPIPESIPHQKSGVLWVGRCETWKNPDKLIHLAKSLPEIPFTMVCPKANAPDLFETIQTQADSLDNVTFLAGIPFEESEKLFSEYQLFVNTSDQEGFPNTFVQACKWGTPIVSLNVNPDNLLEQRSMGVCANGNMETLAETIRDLLKDGEKWKRLSAAARDYALENHDIHINEERLYNLLQSMTARR